MDKLIKGRSYILFGNFPTPKETAQELSDTLGVNIVCMLSKTDNVSAMEYIDIDTELNKLKKENIELKEKLSRKWFK